MKTHILLFLLFFSWINITCGQSNYYFEGTNSAFWLDASNWRNGNMPSVSGQMITIGPMDTVFIQNQASINTAFTVVNNGVLIIGDVVNFSFLSISEIGTFRNLGKTIIEENGLLDTGDGGSIELINGSITDVYGSLSKQEFATLSISTTASVNLFPNALVEIF